MRPGLPVHRPEIAAEVVAVLALHLSGAESSEVGGLRRFSQNVSDSFTGTVLLPTSGRRL